jgi:hypothetical protein
MHVCQHLVEVSLDIDARVSTRARPSHAHMYIIYHTYVYIYYMCQHMSPAFACTYVYNISYICYIYFIYHTYVIYILYVSVYMRM